MYDEMNVGDQASFVVTVDEALVEKFAEVSGDKNPLHMDATYAATTSFHDRIAHGMIVGALFSRLVGMYLPGKYSVYLSQTMKFHAPITIGTTVTIRGKVTQKTDAAKIIILAMSAEDAQGKILTSGEALVQLLQ